MKNKQLLAEIERIIRRHLGDAEFLRRVYAALTMLEDNRAEGNRIGGRHETGQGETERGH